MDRKIVISLIILVAIVSSIGIVMILYPGFFFPRPVLEIYHAGSLTVPFEEYKSLFEREYKEYNVEVRLYSGGSRQLALEITDLGKTPDIYASADYRLIEELLMPTYTNWYIIFAGNEMVLAYTNNSRYADVINESNWYKILNKTDVSWGHSDPNLDPCGYRTLLLLKLAEIYYENPEIYDDLYSHPNRITRPKSVDLLNLLESGTLDYAFEYKSVAIQHHLNYIEFPDQINLGSWEYRDYYSQVNITLDDDTVVYGSPILYGITIIDNASNRELAIEFIRFIFEHSSVLEENGQNPVVPGITNNVSAVPQELRDYVREE
mgnify:CR=1 FL=1